MTSISAGRVTALVRHDLRLIRREPTFLIVMIALPITSTWFLSRTFADLAPAQHPTTTGVRQFVPGMAATFAVMIVSNVGYNFFRESGWGTWDRLQASPATLPELALGLTTGPALSIALQQTVVFGVGVLFFDLRLNGPVLSLALVVAALVVCLVSFGLLLLGVCRSIVQIDLAVQAAALVWAGLGGAIAPLSALPSWMADLAPASPLYWAMNGFQAAIDGAPDQRSLHCALVLLAFSAVFLAGATLGLTRSGGGKLKIG